MIIGEDTTQQERAEFPLKVKENKLADTNFTDTFQHHIFKPHQMFYTFINCE